MVRLLRCAGATRDARDEGSQKAALRDDGELKEKEDDEAEESVDEGEAQNSETDRLRLRTILSRVAWG
jgi:hypothetical protein